MLIDVRQGTPEWFEERKGRLTASNFASAAGLEGSYDSRAQLWRNLKGDAKKEVTGPMLFGSENEGNARHSFEVISGLLVQPVGMYVHSRFDWLGASPDGNISGDSLLETKCRKDSPYETISPQHMAQIQGQLMCAERRTCYFQSWTPSLQKVWLVPLDIKYWDWLWPMLEEFWGYVINDEEPPPLRKRRRYSKEITFDLIHEGESYG